MKDYINKVLLKLKVKKSLSLDEIISKVDELIKEENPSYIMSKNDIEEISNIINNGIDIEYFKTPNDKYKLMSKTSFRNGRFISDKNGNGHVDVFTSYMKDGEPVVVKNSYYIDKELASGAIDGDVVLIEDISSNGKNTRKDGRIPAKVSKIVKRNPISKILGEVCKNGNCYYVRPADKKLQWLYISLPGEAIEGQRVEVEVEESGKNFYIGKILRVFGHKDDPDEDVLWEAAKYGIDDHFSEESLEQVNHTPRVVRDVDKVGREDLTDWEIFTIDGADTKDVDDALSCRILPNGNYQIGVHIADVSYYVSDGSPLDKDAYRKGTSNYLVGRVIPMLPHELSNGICSLNPNVERLAMSCIMEVTPNGKVVKSRISPTIIKSRLKMTYDKVNDILKNGVVDSQYVDHADTLRNLNKLALVLRKNRILRGATEYDRPELKVVLDDSGKVCDFSMRIQDVGENLIEEYMLLANETVDKYVVNHGYPCLHRVHDKPNAEKLDELLQFLGAINYSFMDGYSVCGEDIVENRKYMQELIEHVSNAGSLSGLLILDTIKCNSRAKYSPNNIGHYGLAKDNYCHFTSPIRRYPDLTVHRIIKDIQAGKGKKGSDNWAVRLPEIGERTSRLEKNADDCEEATLKMKCCEYMEDHIGDEYECTIISIADNGMTVELDNTIEGYVRIKDLKGEYCSNPEQHSMVSMEGFEDYYIGDRLKVKVLRASKEDKKINFGVIEKISENKPKGADLGNRDFKMLTKMKRANEFYKK